MDSLHSLTSPQNPPQTFLDKKPPLLPRQSTSDVLSFTHIIANRLSPGQNVWDFFSPPPDPDAMSEHNSGLLSPTSPIPITSPTLIKGQHFQPQGVSTAPTTRSPSPAIVPVSAQLPPLMISGVAGRRQSAPNTSEPGGSCGAQEHCRSPTSITATLESRPPLPPPSSSSPSPQPTPQEAVSATATGATTAASQGSRQDLEGGESGWGSIVVEAVALPVATTPKLQKRRSFAQSLKSGMLSLTQMLSPTSASFDLASNSNGNHSCNTTAVSSPTMIKNGPPHYNILVLGSDSAPLASTLYKMSSLLPAATKIRHYQEISGFFVAYFRSKGSFSCSPKTSTDGGERGSTSMEKSRAVRAKAQKETSAAVLLERKLSGLFEDEVKPRRQSTGQDSDDQESADNDDGGSASLKSFKMTRGRSSEETLHQLKISSTNGTASTVLEQGQEQQEEEEVVVNESNDQKDFNDGTVSIADTLETITEDDGHNDDDRPPSSQELVTGSEQESYDHHHDKEQEPDLDNDDDHLHPSANSNATLSVHAFSLDTTWPVPRILAQTFWFPFAHGIIYIVDATRKNDPRGIDHLLNARQFLNSLISDPFFKRRDIPVVVFANKAGLDPETCYRVDEIAEILGCEDWDVVTTSSPTSAGSGSGSEEDGQSSATAGGGMMTMMMRRTKSDEGPGGKVAASQQQPQHRTRPWCVKSTRSDGAGDGLRESVEWLKSRMGEVWRT